MEDNMGGPIKSIDYQGRYVANDMHYAKDSFVLVDNDGNIISYELQSVSLPDMEGYAVSPMNSELINETAENHERLLNSAKKYFLEHPEKKPKGEWSENITALTSAYMRELEIQATKQREEQGTATSMELAYLHQREYLIATNQCLSMSQILGETDFLNPENLKPELEVHPNRTQSSFEKAFMEAGNNDGEENLRSQMKKDAKDANNAEIDIYNQENLNEEQVNDLIKQVIENAGRE